jgi:hypothetical protein
MSHKDFVRIAGIIAGLHLESEDDPTGNELRQHVAQQFADGLRGTNSAFDRSRFIAAAMGKPLTGRDRVR